jgi:subfamily B ATP-binding cassette protein MsbA
MSHSVLQVFIKHPQLAKLNIYKIKEDILNMIKKLKSKFLNSYTVTNIRKMWPYIKPYKFRALMALLLTIPLGALDAVIAFSLKPFMDSVMIEKSVETAYYVPFIIIGFTFIQAVIGYAAYYLNAWVGNKMTIDLKQDMFAKMMSLESKFYDNMQTGEILNRFVGDVDVACAGLLKSFKLFTTRLFSSISLIFVLFYHSWQLALVAITVLFFALVPLSTFRKRIKGFNQDLVLAAGAVGTHYTETIAGNKVVASYNLQNKRSKEIVDKNQKVFRLQMKMVQRTAFLPSLMTFAVSIGIAIIIWYGSYLIVSGEITGGTFVSFIAALIMLYNPIKTIGNNFSAVQIALLSMERIFKLQERVPDITSKENAVKLNGVSKEIKFDKVNFSYDGENDVLKNINLTIPAGKVYAFVGNSGGGKSTIVSLLPRFYDVQGGAVTIDGVDLKDLDLTTLRSNISVVQQDNFLFAGSIRDNIALGGDYTDEQIMKAVELANLQEFIESQEEGLDLDVGERGNLLSGGQKQRVSIARAFLKNSPIVIFDEATSALDNKSEKAIQKAMEELMKDRTVLVIAHRLSTIKNADQIVVVNDGEIVEKGTHDELIAKTDGAYKALHSTSR